MLLSKSKKTGIHNAKQLRQVDLFKELDDIKLWWIAQKTEAKFYSKGELVIEEGTLADGIFFVVDGHVKVCRTNREGRQIIIQILSEGEFFGEISLLDGESRSADIIAVNDVQILYLPKSTFMELLNNYPTISINLLTELATRMRKSAEQITWLTLSSAERRIGVVILKIAEESGTVFRNTVLIENFATQKDLSDMVGASRETVNSTLKSLEKDDMISRDGKSLIINNFSKFQKRYN